MELDNPQHEVTVTELDGLCEQIFLVNAKCDAIETELELKKKELQALQYKMQQYLEASGKKKWDGSLGTVELYVRSSVKTPKTKEDKELFSNWLVSKGLDPVEEFGINSQRLNAIYNSELRIAQEEGRLLEIPGVGEPTLFITTKLRKK